MMRKTGAIDEGSFRAALNAACHVASDRHDVSAPAGAVLVRWHHDHFAMRVRHIGRNSFATVLHARIVPEHGGPRVYYRVAGWADPWGWLIAVGFFGAAWVCWREPHLASRASCWIPVIAGVGTLLLVGLGRYATRRDAATMVALVENAVSHSPRPD